MTPPFVAANRLAEAGLPVFFCNAKKFPTCKGGFKAATSDPDQLLDLWRRSPGPLIGVATGAASGIDALDIDPKDGGQLWLGDNYANLPVTRCHGTRSGGHHFLFQHHPGLRCSASKIAPGVDIRADGGFLLWWPAFGLAVENRDTVAPWPLWLIESITPPPTPRPPAPAGAPGPGYASAALRRATEAVGCARPGTRNETLNREAYSLSRFAIGGALDPQIVANALATAALSAGLSEREIRATLASAFRAGGIGP